MRRQFALEESELGLKLKTCCAALRSAHLSAGQMLPGCGFDSVEGMVKYRRNECYCKGLALVRIRI